MRPWMYNHISFAVWETFTEISFHDITQAYVALCEI